MVISTPRAFMLFRAAASAGGMTYFIINLIISGMRLIIIGLFFRMELQTGDE